MALFCLRFRLMQKLYWLFCVINFTFPQSCYIWQLNTKGLDFPVPVDKHDIDKNLPPPDPLGGSKVKVISQ